MISESGGLFWPSDDIHCRQAIYNEMVNIQHIVPYVKDFSNCIQAGGNVGAWPKEFSRYFGAVYTYEPDPLNFKCLVMNCDEPNIIKTQAALGDAPDFIDLNRTDNNCGAHFVDRAGVIPVMQIDNLGLPTCGLMQLDIEGMELKALKGGIFTINRCKPVIVVEEKGLGDRYGAGREDITNFLSLLGYSIAKTVNHDIIYTPN